MVPAGQGRLLGRRDQARAGAGPAGLPGVHAQAPHRHRLPGLRAGAARPPRRDLPAVRHPQRRHHRRHPADGARGRARAFELQRLHGMGERHLPRGAARTRPSPAASMRRWASTATCWPTWCAACWRTAPTRPSCTSWPTSRSVPMSCCARRCWPRPAPRCRCRPRCSAPRAPTRAGVDLACAAMREPLLTRRWSRPCRAAAPRLARPRSTRRWARLQAGFAAWNARSRWPSARAVLRRAGDALDARLPEFCALLVEEAHKTLGDCVAEVREAVDFCRYYAEQAELAGAQTLPGPPARATAAPARPRRLRLHQPVELPAGDLCRPGGGRAGGRQHGGGQAGRADAGGGAALRRPAARGRRARATRWRWLHGAGETVGAALVADARTAGVCFTGSTEVARLIHRALAAKDGPIVPLIAETGGLNAMIVDTTALPEQVVDAVVQSAFRSAGQRCSALRLLCVHESIADGVIEMLRGALAELRLGDPALLATDVGPRDRRRGLREHLAPCRAAAKVQRDSLGEAAPRRGRCREPGGAGGLRDRLDRRPARGDLRPGAACRALGRRRRRGGHADQRAGLRPDAGHADPHRQPRRPHRRRRPASATSTSTAT